MDVESYLLGKKASGGGGGTSDTSYVLKKGEYYTLSEMKAGVYTFDEITGTVRFRLNPNYESYSGINIGSLSPAFRCLIIFRDNTKESDLNYLDPLIMYYNENNKIVTPLSVLYNSQQASGLVFSQGSGIAVDTLGYLQKVSGYSASKTQTLKNVNGTLTWVDD